MTALAVRLLDADSGRQTGVSASLISAIGSEDFTDQFLLNLNELCGVEHCSIVQFRGDQLYGKDSSSLDHSAASSDQLRLYLQGDLWRRDPCLQEAQRQVGSSSLSLVGMDIAGIEDAALRPIWSAKDIAHRLLLWSGTQESAIGVSLCRSSPSGDFTEAQVVNLQRASLTLLSVLKKHAAIRWSTPRFPHALTCLENIEICVRNGAPWLPRREYQVCCRLIYGMTTTGVSLDLGIGEGSVMTYRKRLYERLHIASQRELLIWYVSLWDQMFSKAMRED